MVLRRALCAEMGFGGNIGRGLGVGGAVGVGGMKDMTTRGTTGVTRAAGGVTLVRMVPSRQAAAALTQMLMEASGTAEIQ